MTPEWPENFQPEVVRDGFGGKLTSFTVALEAWRRGLTVAFLSHDISRFRISDDAGNSVRFVRSRPDRTTLQAVHTANDKHRTVEHLRAAGIPAPHSVRAPTAETPPDSLVARADDMGYPVVLKPSDGSMGKGVFANISNSDELRRRYYDLTHDLRCEEVVLETHAPGEDHRVLVMEDRYLGSCRRVPANVVGDGEHTVQQLIAQKNRERKLNPFLSKGLIKHDAEVDDYLGRHDLTMTSVPAANAQVQLRSAANASAGGDVVDTTDEIPDEIRQAAIRAVDAVPGLHCAGVDVLIDRDEDGVVTSYTVLELNAHPQIGVNMYPTHGRGVDAPRDIIDVYFPDSERRRDPGEKYLTIPLRDTVWPLQTGAAEEVTLAPLPDHHHPLRRLYGAPRHHALTRREINRLRVAARRHTAAGYVEYLDGRVKALIAGSRDSSAEMVDDVQKILDVTFTSEGSWDGPLAAGFQVKGE